jgi:hypothetical protein
MSTADSTVIAPPQTVRIAYWLYIVGAILGIIGAIVLAITLPASIASGQAALNRSLQGQSTKGIDVEAFATGAAIGGVAISGVITLAFSILTIVFARKMLLGRNWARIVLAVFAAAQIFGAFNVVGTYGVSSLHFIVVLAGLILSFLPASNAWFRAMKPVRQYA